MATNEQALDQTLLPVEAGLDEDSIISSLARLQELHISVCHSPDFEDIKSIEY